MDFGGNRRGFICTFKRRVFYLLKKTERYKVLSKTCETLKPQKINYLDMILNPESEILDTLAKSILLAARTAPKAKGVDDIVTAFVEKGDIEILALTMEKLADEKGAGFDFLKRDAVNLRNAGVAILIGVKTSGAAGLFFCTKHVGTLTRLSCADGLKSAACYATPHRLPRSSFKGG